MKQLTAILIGAGARGAGSYGSYALQFPHELKFVAVSEPKPLRRESFARAHGIPEECCYDSWEPLLEKPKMADIAIICTQDNMHGVPTIRALERKYHVLLEKPMSPDPKECIRMEQAAKREERMLSICHVMRYAPFWTAIKQLLDEGKIGRIVSIQLNENVGFWHMAHSFVRGPWCNSNTSSPMILAKSCHDMDALSWLMDEPCVSLSSFGSLMHFHPGNAPEGATDFCLDGCAAADTCPYYAPGFYLKDEGKWWARYFTDDPTRENIVKGLRETPYGRCVYKSDNNVVDHQVVSMAFASGATAVFSMCAFTKQVNRSIQIMGTRGEIRGEEGRISLSEFLTGQETKIEIAPQSGRHGGGDQGLMRSFLSEVRLYNGQESRTSAAKSVRSHMMAFAAEESRLHGGRSINLDQFYENLAGSI